MARSELRRATRGGAGPSRAIFAALTLCATLLCSSFDARAADAGPDAPLDADTAPPDASSDTLDPTGDAVGDATGDATGEVTGDVMGDAMGDAMDDAMDDATGDATDALTDAGDAEVATDARADAEDADAPSPPPRDDSSIFPGDPRAKPSAREDSCNCRAVGGVGASPGMAEGALLAAACLGGARLLRRGSARRARARSAARGAGPSTFDLPREPASR